MARCPAGPRRPQLPVHSASCALRPGAARPVEPMIWPARRVPPAPGVDRLFSVGTRPPPRSHHPKGTVSRAPVTRFAPVSVAQGSRSPPVPTAPSLARGHGPSDTIPGARSLAVLRSGPRSPRTPAPKAADRLRAAWLRTRPLGHHLEGARRRCPCPQPPPNLAQAGGNALSGPRGVTVVGCAPALFAPRARRLPAPRPRARPPAPRTAPRPRAPAHLLDGLLRDLPFASRPGGREGHRHGPSAGSARDHRGFFSRCAPPPEVFILRSRWGAGARGVPSWARPPRRCRRAALPAAAAPPRASPVPEAPPCASAPGGRSAPRAGPAAAASSPAAGCAWFAPAPPRRARVRPTPQTLPDAA